MALEIGAVTQLERLPQCPGKWHLVTDSQDIAAVADYAPLPEDTTGVIIEAHDGDIGEVWATQWSQPWLHTSSYERIK